MSSSFPCQTIEATLIANNVERTLSVPFQVFMRGWTGGWRSLCPPLLISEGRQGTAVPSWVFPPRLVPSWLLSPCESKQELPFDMQWEVCQEKKVGKCLCKASCDAHLKILSLQERELILLTCSRSATLPLCLPGFSTLENLGFTNSSIKSSVKFLSGNVNSCLSGYIVHFEWDSCRLN